jgi:hypothetical protein
MRSFLICTLQNDRVKEDEMGRTCSMHGCRRGIHVRLPWGSQRERDHYEDLDIVGGIILHRIRWYGLDLSGSGKGPMEVSCEYGNEPLGYIKRSEVLE